MKKILIILLLTGCSVLKHTNKNTLETSNSKQNQLLEHVSGLELSTSDLLSRSWTADSTFFQAYILADGPYILSPDSGIRGSNARIYLQGTKTTKKLTQDSGKSQELHTKDSLSMQTSSEHSSQKQKSSINKRIGLPLSWYIVPILLLLAWFFIKKIQKPIG